MKNIMVLCMIIFILSGCTVVRSPKELMKRPESYGYKEETQKVIFKFLTGTKVLTLALSEKDKESVRMVDLDNDGKDELVLLYKEGKDIYGVMILKEKDGIWYKINDIERSGNGIDAVEYKDITGDQRPDILIGWKDTEKSFNYLEVFSSHEGYFKSIERVSYIDFSIYDIDDDGKNEIILLEKLTQSNDKRLKIFKYVDEEIVSVD